MNFQKYSMLLIILTQYKRNKEMILKANIAACLFSVLFQS